MATYTFDTLFDFELANIALPSGYTKLNYIENLGNASTYIETNYVANGNTKLRALVSINTAGQNSMGYIGTYRYGFDLMGSGFYSYVNTSNYYYVVNTSIGQKRLIEIDNISKNVSLDGVVLGTMTTISYPIGGTYWIGRLHNYNSEYFNGKIYYHEFLENGTPIQKMIPCQDSNNNIGMYDIVTNTFFANQGTNPFLSGGEAQTQTYQDGDVVTITDVGITLTYTNGNLYFSTNESLTLFQFNSLRSICKGTNGVVVTITDLNNLQVTSNGTDWIITADTTIATLSQFNSLCGICKGANGVVVTITDLNNLQVTSNGTDWLITADTTIATLSQFNSLCSICKGTDGVVVTISENKSYYRWQNNDWEFWYQETEPLVFKGITFEQTDYWQIPESVFRGFSFEIVYKKGGGVLFKGIE